MMVQITTEVLKETTGGLSEGIISGLLNKQTWMSLLLIFLIIFVCFYLIHQIARFIPDGEDTEEGEDNSDSIPEVSTSKYGEGNRYDQGRKI